MRAILDTNIIVSALMSRGGTADTLLRAGLAGRFDLVIHRIHLEEVRDVTRRTKFRGQWRPSAVGKLVNAMAIGPWIDAKLPAVRRSPDPNDDWLLALAEVAAAAVLVTGDKADLLALGKHGATRIITARQFHDELGL